MSKLQLSSKVAIVTGASSGIGRATALLFAREGARVIVTARRRSELDAVVSEIAAFGGEAIAVDGDVRDESLARTLVARAIDRFGGLDIAFNNAAAVGELVPLAVETNGRARRDRTRRAVPRLRCVLVRHGKRDARRRWRVDHADMIRLPSRILVIGRLDRIEAE